MNREKAEQLTRIYNTLMLISTKGEDTLVMADCLNALKALASRAKKRIRRHLKNEADHLPADALKTQYEIILCLQSSHTNCSIYI